MADPKDPQDNMFKRENVVVHETRAVGGDVPPAGHVHEERDVPLRTLLKATGYLVFGIIAAAAAMWGLFEVLASRAESNDPEVSPMVERQLPPQPRLQSNPGRDMTAFRAKEDSAVKARSTDTAAGAVVIPVEEAMSMIAQHGLPRFKSSAADTADTTPESDRTVGAGNPASGASRSAGSSATTPRAPSR